MYTVSLDDRINRDDVVSDLSLSGIETRVSFPPIHTQPYYLKRYNINKKNYLTTYKAWKSLLNLPIWVGLPEKEQSFVIEKLINSVKSKL